MRWLLAIGAAVAAWFAWRWYSAPTHSFEPSYLAPQTAAPDLIGNRLLPPPMAGGIANPGPTAIQRTAPLTVGSYS